jgi:EmrB/QacA subfamily drug resistance transporter
VSQQTLSPPVPQRAEAPRQRPGLALAVIVTCQLMLILDMTVMNVALPRIRAALGFSVTDLSWVINSYALAYGGLLLLGGRAGDILGRRRTFIAGLGLFTAASLVGGVATSAGWLLAARVLQGVGAALAGPSTLALITTTVTDPRERIRALALLSGVASGGLAIGLIVGGLLTESLSWRWVLFINVPVGVAAIVLARRYVREPQRHPARLDVPGAVTATAGMAALVYGLIHAAAVGWSDRQTLVALGAGLVLVAAFLAIEARTRQPLLPLRLFTDRNRAAGYANFFLGPAAGLSMFFFLTQFLQQVRGFSALETGLAFLPLALVLFAVSRTIPYVLPRLGPRRLAVTGVVAMIAGLAWLTRLSESSGYLTALLGPLLLMGFGIGAAFAPLNVVIMSTVEPRDAGAAGGALQTMQQTGAALGLAVLVTVFGTTVRHAAGGHPVAAPDLVLGMTHAFAAGVLICTLSLLVALTFRVDRPS